MPRRAEPKRARFLTLGWQIAAWIELFLRHGPGDVRGQEIELLDSEVAHLARIYQLHPRTGRRLVDEALYSRPKGSRKSELYGMIGCAEFVGPVRFDHWAEPGERAWWDESYEFETGEPVGRPVTDPFIRCMATEEEQAGNTYDNIAVMMDLAAEHFPDMFGAVDLGRSANTSTRLFLPWGGEVRPSTSANASKDGGKETFPVFDETHLYVSRELREMYFTVAANARKRVTAEPWLAQTSTMYRPGQNSIAEQTHAVRGKPGLLIDHREAEGEIDLTDRQKIDFKLLERKLRKLYGEMTWVDVDGILADFADPRKDLAQLARLFLNQAHASADTFCTPGRWDALRDNSDPLMPGDDIALGFDGSTYRDSTMLVAVRIRDAHAALIAAWEAPEGPAGETWSVPRPAVKLRVRRTFETYRVRAFGFDPPGWWDESAEWHGEYGKVAQEFFTSKPRYMGPAVEHALESLDSGSMSHDGNPVLRRHVLNARLVDDHGYKGLRKPVEHGPEKIDGCVSWVIAHKKRAEVIALGADEPGEEYAEFYGRR